MYAICYSCGLFVISNLFQRSERHFVTWNKHYCACGLRQPRRNASLRDQLTEGTTDPCGSAELAGEMPHLRLSKLGPDFYGRQTRECFADI